MSTTKSTNGGTTAATDFFSDMFKTTMDMDKMIEAQRKNVEALVEAQRVAFEGYKTAMERQVALMKEAMNEYSNMTGDLFSGKTPEANASKQAELAQNAFRNAFENSREIAEITTKTNQDAFAVLQKRFTEGVEEMKSATTAAKK
ncbi:phasin family protein [Rhodothalassium salexigens DSM 2132]|uniref:Phasin family protein n=1 Tax=Rhodothalassium salexigens DSM 2132 TaxID=1188247 RepID=A0A4R2PQE0_RHOSA|nr:TIGR01841 family phasin [Rhodothalassium salexigens]MBB4210431.1 phasin family protein [Rhodothalassium salexigens DSM 2132]TCP38012.1 phasin family protein [Rhodothalassium salexigens DSM 2132]